MRSAVGKALRSQFEARLRSTYPAFHRMALPLPAGSRKYEWQVSERLSVYLMLQLDDRHDRFNLSIGFGEAGHSPPPTSPQSYDEAVDAPGFFVSGPLVQIPNQGTISAVNVLTKDGWLRFPGGP
jgi:hypothetical protein